MMRRDHIIVHHTGAEEKDAAQVKRYHLSLGWRAVGYNYILERDGRVVEGRPLDVPGAHCRSGGMNRRGIGVALIGNLDNHPPTRRQVEVLPTLLTRLMETHGIPPDRVLGHREVSGAATACPGRYLDMHALRKKLHEDPGTGILVLREEHVPLDGGKSAIIGPGTAKQPGGTGNAGNDCISVPEQQAGAHAAEPVFADRGMPEPIGPVLWRVLAGVYRTRREAESRARQLHEMGIDALVVPPD